MEYIVPVIIGLLFFMISLKVSMGKRINRTKIMREFSQKAFVVMMETKEDIFIDDFMKKFYEVFEGDWVSELDDHKYVYLFEQLNDFIDNNPTYTHQELKNKVKELEERLKTSSKVDVK